MYHLVAYLHSDFSVRNEYYNQQLNHHTVFCDNLCNAALELSILNAFYFHSEATVLC